MQTCYYDHSQHVRHLSLWTSIVVFFLLRYYIRIILDTVNLVVPKPGRLIFVPEFGTTTAIYNFVVVFYPDNSHDTFLYEPGVRFFSNKKTYRVWKPRLKKIIDKKIDHFTFYAKQLFLKMLDRYVIKSSLNRKIYIYKKWHITS